MFSIKMGYKIRAKVHEVHFFHQQTSIHSTFGLDCHDRETSVAVWEIISLNFPFPLDW